MDTKSGRLPRKAEDLIYLIIVTVLAVWLIPLRRQIYVKAKVDKIWIIVINLVSVTSY